MFTALKAKLVQWFFPSEAEIGVLVAKYLGSTIRHALQLVAGFALGSVAANPAAETFVNSGTVVVSSLIVAVITQVWSYLQKAKESK